MNQQTQVRRDLAEFRAELRGSAHDHQAWLQCRTLRCLVDITFDLSVIALAIAACARLGLWLAPLALLVIGNRQRSLGNILHDGSHGNLSRRRWINDLILRVLLAPLLFASLTKYRRDHARHHARLGDADGDPDFIRPIQGECRFARLEKLVLDRRAWWTSFAADLGARDTGAGAWVTITGWWLALGTLIGQTVGWPTLILFASLWLLARATVFHLITCFRELCDHQGLTPGGIYSYTRDIVATGWRSWLFHPRNDGLHLTHHLLPGVPYHQLRVAQRAVRTFPSYQTRARLHADYAFARPAAAVPTLVTAG
jgi:fatty acid desaturase